MRSNHVSTGGRRRPTALLLGIGLMFGLGLTACGGAAGGAGDAPVALDGEYRLVAGRGPSGDVPILDDGPITLTIDGEQWGGTAACNSYGGTVTTDGQDLTVGDVFRTEMACLDEEIMRAEQVYLDAFSVVDAFTRDGDDLVLSGPDTELSFAFVPPEPDAPLIGTTWILTSLVHGTGEDGAVSSVTGEPTLEFTEDGTFTAGTGCNTLGGSYTLDGTTLTIREVGGTEAGCPDSLTASQEEMVAAILDSGELSVEIDGGNLRLVAPDNRGLDYRALPDSPSDG